MSCPPPSHLTTAHSVSPGVWGLILQRTKKASNSPLPYLTTDLPCSCSPFWGPRMSTGVLWPCTCRTCHNHRRGRPDSHPDTRSPGLGQFAKTVWGGGAPPLFLNTLLPSIPLSPVTHEGPSQSGHCLSRMEGQPSPPPPSGISSTFWFSHTQGSHF